MEANVSSPEKIYYPSIYGEDFAGNVAILKNTSTTVSYSNSVKGKSGDYRLFVDSTIPDKREIDTSSWNDGKDGVKADGLTPELDRLGVSKYVVRGNTVTLKTSGERNARGVFIISNSTSESQVVNPTYTNCTAGSNPTVGGLITKFGESCLLTYTYTFPSNFGTQKENGEANDSKSFSFYQMDLSGNASVNSTNSVVVYSDKTASSLNQNTVDSPNIVRKDVSITKDLSVNISGIVERNSDIEITGTNPSGVAITSNMVNMRNDANADVNVNTSRIIKAGNKVDAFGNVIGTVNYIDCSINPCKETNIKSEYSFGAQALLGSKADTTFALSGNRRIGTGEDGIYIFKIREIDTAGNRSIWKDVKIERDTVAPNAPALTLTKVVNSIDLQVTGETNSKFNLKILEGNTEVANKSLDNFTGVSTFNSAYMMKCGNISYTVKYSQSDEVGNTSPESSQSVISNPCPAVVLNEDGEVDYNEPNVYVHDTPIDLMVAGSSSIQNVADTKAQYDRLQTILAYELADVGVRMELFKIEVKKCVNNVAETLRDAAVIANRDYIITAHGGIIILQKDANFAKNEYANKTISLRDSLITKCQYRKTPTTYTPSSADIKELDAYVDQKLKIEFNLSDSQVNQRTENRNWNNAVEAIKANWVDFAISMVAGFAIATACTVATGVTLGLAVAACIAIGSVFFDIAFDAYRGKLSVEGIGLSILANSIGAILSAGLLSKAFSILSKSGVRYVWRNSLKTFVVVSDEVEASLQTVLTLKFSDIAEVKFVQTIGEARFFAVTLSNPFKKVTSASINAATRAVSMTISNELPTATYNAIKTYAGSNVTKINELWYSLLGQGKYRGIEIITGNSTKRAVFNFATNEVLTISEAEGLNALQKKAPDLLKYQELKNVLVGYLNNYTKGSYYQISNIFTGYKPALGIEVHHLVEQRLYEKLPWLKINFAKLGMNSSGSIPSMAMTVTEHQEVSNLLESIIKTPSLGLPEFQNSSTGKELIRAGYEKAYTQIGRIDIYNHLNNLGIFN